jgi:long-chain acyl-CoA synthetase
LREFARETAAGSTRKDVLHITGRFKDEYKLANGKYVHPESIENEMKLMPWGRQTTIIYGEGKEFNVAVVVPDFAALKADPATQAWVKDTLEETLQAKR